MNQTTPLEQECIQLIKKADAVVREMTKVTLKAMIAGNDNRTAIEMGNAVLVKAGRKPLDVDSVLAKIKEAQA